MATTSSTTIPDVGYLRSCMDRRFVAVTRGVFERLAGVKADAYYHEAFAGGTLGTLADLAASQSQLSSPPTPPAANGADYVYNRSFVNEKDINLIVMGWQVHLDHCGGLPNLPTDSQIIDAFRRAIVAGIPQGKYPLVKKHIFLAAPPPTLPSPPPPDTTITFDNTGGSYTAWIRVFYRNPDGQLLLWESQPLSAGTTTSAVFPGGSTYIYINGGSVNGATAPSPSSNPVLSNAVAGGDLPSTLAGTSFTISFSGTQSAPTLTVPSALM